MDIDENAVGNMSQQDVTRTTDNETGHDPRKDQPQVPLPPNDEAPVDDDMTDVAANNSVSSEHPQEGTSAQDENDQEARGLPASDPESGA
ncbi:hypothetical protein [Pseudomonas sp. G5(2012)]|uniref:hypothetical protein n=1 Tax=Pseudomonas sp. G5(2012) TaxID=1268068 RepID=UPI0003431071|nr:hypothetical protein [Pseudomonas sp. G5(2012)]EPA93997.1 hypothetical protein PG5_55380 [Pseudomonas sp. G5(2012)]